MENFSDLKISENGSERFSNISQKKILYFSDGTLEVDEEVEEKRVAELDSKPLSVNPQELNWFPWMWYQTVAAGSKALEICDYMGESLASFFGITTPKYQFEINEYMRLKKAEDEEKAQDETEMGTWTENPNSDIMITNVGIKSKISHLNNSDGSTKV